MTEHDARNLPGTARNLEPSMKKIPKNVKKGTTVVISGLPGVHKITEINETRVNFKIANYLGSFQWGHVDKIAKSEVPK